VIVDPKGKDFSIYKATTLTTPNWDELAQGGSFCSDIAAAAAEVNRTVGSEAVLVTRSESGMSLIPSRGEPVHVDGCPVAGDTLVAVLSPSNAGAAWWQAYCAGAVSGEALPNRPTGNCERNVACSSRPCQDS
jgi:D-beta-D-heptose 7-phosphate kinase/D-beta-D-heptose 1-phosphate adenosyltransferase